MKHIKSIANNPVDEVLGVLTDVQKHIQKPALRSSPQRYSRYLYLKFSGQTVPESYQDPLGVNHAIRQIHDFYGWMAKHGRNGVCAGALYRTAEFMAIKANTRNGSRTAGRNIHIEHTVPVAVLAKHLEYSMYSTPSPETFHQALIKHSICVAFSYEEELRMNTAGVPRSRNSAFDASGKRLHEFPFRRYLPLLQYSRTSHVDFRIFNVVTGREIDLERFTFEEHQETLHKVTEKLLGIQMAGYSLYGI